MTPGKLVEITSRVYLPENDRNSSAKHAQPSTIRVGIGGWTFEPWRGVFYPKGLPHTRELEHASRQLTAIEINGTYRRTQTPATFSKWAKATPDNFVFAVKASFYATSKKVLAEAGESVDKFLGSGLVELGDKLGPILWQFFPTKRFEPEDFGAFLKLLPERREGVRLRHAVEVRHDSFCDPVFVELARTHGVAIVYAHSEKFPAIADATGDFVYARLQGTHEKIETGYSAKELDRWASITHNWAMGNATELPQYGTAQAKVKARDVFVFMISGAKVRAPAAAMALMERLKSHR